jgi:hypothetical protein
MSREREISWAQPEEIANKRPLISAEDHHVVENPENGFSST